MNWQKNHDNIEKLGLYSWYVLLFLQAFYKFGALRQIAIFILLFCIVYAIYQGKRISLIESPVFPVLAIALLIILWIVLVSLVGPYPVESIKTIRKDFLVQILLLLAPSFYIKNINDAYKVIHIILAGFIVLTLLSSIEVIATSPKYNWEFHELKNNNLFYDGYGGLAGVYVPLLVAFIYFNKHKNTKLATFYWAILVISVSLIFVYGSRAPLLAAGLSSALLLILFKKWRVLLGLISFSIIGALTIQNMNMGYLNRYSSLASRETYTTNQGLSQRISVWQGTIDVIKDRPFLGYGYGWKKLATVINENNFAEYWADRPDIRNYYLSEKGGEIKASYGRVNPHNYFIQIAFEIGIVGLLLVMAFWFSIIWLLVKIFKHDKKDTGNFVIAYSGLLFAYMLSNIANGYWIGSLSNIVLACTGCLLVIGNTRLPSNKKALNEII